MRPRQIILAAALSGLLCVPVLVGAPKGERKAEIDRKLSRVEERARAARGREQVLTSDVAAFTQKVRAIEARLAPLAERRDRLVARETRLRSRLKTVNVELRSQQTRLVRAEDSLRARRLALITKIRARYRSRPESGLSQILTGSKISVIAADSAAARRVMAQDEELVRTVAAYAEEVRVRRDRIQVLRDSVRTDTIEAAAAAREARAATVGLERSRNELNRVRSRKQVLLASIVESREDLEAEAKDLRRQSLRLANEIVRAQGGSAAYSGPPSASGFIWPVNAVITSRFGWRWGRMHEGVDLGVGMGVPIAASAAGRVIVAGWNGGYGQLVVIDHGGGLSTAYAHQSRIAVAVGQEVTQGQVIGYVGSTGHSTGPHLHFEVRVNGAARDPLGYL